MRKILTNTFQSGHNTVEQLLATATATWKLDRPVATACIIKAAALLGTGVEETGSGHHYPTPCRGGLVHWQVRRVADYIREHLSEKIPTSDLAELVKLSRSRFSRAFRRSFGTKPTRYVGQQRMKLAQDLMLNTQESLTQIALSCGMCDHAHFSRMFLRFVGMRPRDWRRFARSSIEMEMRTRLPPPEPRAAGSPPAMTLSRAVRLPGGSRRYDPREQP